MGTENTATPFSASEIKHTPHGFYQMRSLEVSPFGQWFLAGQAGKLGKAISRAQARHILITDMGADSHVIKFLETAGLLADDGIKFNLKPAEAMPRFEREMAEPVKPVVRDPEPTPVDEKPLVHATEKPRQFKAK